mmetsp:Transcript_17680/g.48901  ORF Transcript_17680/g.48901 Transcript_17680/m.48901 type:complete len:102 (-) Transcript_17680:6191-6496(-)
MNPTKTAHLRDKIRLRATIDDVKAQLMPTGRQRNGSKPPFHGALEYRSLPVYLRNSLSTNLVHHKTMKKALCSMTGSEIIALLESVISQVFHSRNNTCTRP